MTNKKSGYQNSETPELTVTIFEFLKYKMAGSRYFKK